MYKGCICTSTTFLSSSSNLSKVKCGWKHAYTNFVTFLVLWGHWQSTSGDGEKLLKGIPESDVHITTTQTQAIEVT